MSIDKPTAYRVALNNTQVKIKKLWNLSYSKVLPHTGRYYNHFVYITMYGFSAPYYSQYVYHSTQQYTQIFARNTIFALPDKFANFWRICWILLLFKSLNMILFMFSAYAICRVYVLELIRKCVVGNGNILWHKHNYHKVFSLLITNKICIHSNLILDIIIPYTICDISDWLSITKQLQVISTPAASTNCNWSFP